MGVKTSYVKYFLRFEVIFESEEDNVNDRHVDWMLSDDRCLVDLEMMED